MSQTVDQVIIGGGAMGLATAWQLASRGGQVVLAEQFAQGHELGASHGSTRNLNNAYAQAHYLDLFDEAVALWADLERRSGERLITRCGLVSHGDPNRVSAAASVLQERGVEVELISSAEAESRWPGMRFTGEVLVNPQAGRVHAATALEVLARLASEDGADLRFEHRVVDLTERADGVTVTVENSRGERQAIRAKGAVVTAGAWTAGLIGDRIRLPRLRVTEEHPAHFMPLPEYERSAWPSFNHFAASGDETMPGSVYGMESPGEGIKVGFHAIGDEVDPDRRRFGASEAQRELLRQHVARWFPGLDPDSAAEISCTYTLTPDEDFILDRVGRITIGAGFSGHGFKFVPAIGRVLADLAETGAQAPEPFRLHA